MPWWRLKIQIRALRDAGLTGCGPPVLTVTRGVAAEQARWITRGHIVRVTERRPLVTLKLALDANGQVPRGDGAQPNFVTSPQARAHGHLLRAMNDAILVGAGTVKADNPELTCRLPGLEPRTPLRVVLSQIPAGAASQPGSSTMRATFPVLCVTGFGVDGQLRGGSGCEGCRTGAGDDGRRPTLAPAVMETLVARGITRLLVEGGPAIWRSFADGSLADEVVVYMAGGAAQSGHGSDILARVAYWLGPLPLAIADTRALGPDRLWRLRPAH